MIIDELILVIGMDTAKLTQGQKDAIAAFKKTKEESVQAGKDIEAHGKQIDSFFTRVKTGVMGLAGAFLTGLGAKEFTSYITTLDASASRLSRTLEMSVEELSIWQGVARRSGGSAESMAGAMNSLSQQIHQFNAGMGTGPFLAVFNSLGIGIKNANGSLKTMGQLFRELNEAVNTGRISPADALARLTAAGIDQTTINTLLLKQLPQMLAQQKEISVTTTDGAQQAERLARAWSEAEQSSESFGRSILTVAGPALINMLETVRDLFKTGPDGILGQTLHWFLPSFFPGRTGAAPSGGGATGAAPSGSSSKSEIESYIRASAIKRGIDPDVAVAVARSEGLNKYVGDQGTSFGPFQLHYKNNIPGLSNGGLGDVFTRQTGLDARDPATTRQQIDFAMDQARKGGWGPWHGWRGLPFAGIGNGLGPGAGASISNSSVGGDTRTSSSSTTIGKIEVHTQATDADGIAADIGPALKRSSFAAPSNYGQQ